MYTYVHVYLSGTFQYDYTCIYIYVYIDKGGILRISEAWYKEDVRSP